MFEFQQKHENSHNISKLKTCYVVCFVFFQTFKNSKKIKLKSNKQKQVQKQQTHKNTQTNKNKTNHTLNIQHFKK